MRESLRSRQRGALPPTRSGTQQRDARGGGYLPSPLEIERAKSARGGWTKAQLAAWGVSWPPPKGWRRGLEREWLRRQEG